MRARAWARSCPRRGESWPPRPQDPLARVSIPAALLGGRRYMVSKRNGRRRTSVAVRAPLRAVQASATGPRSADVDTWPRRNCRAPRQCQRPCHDVRMPWNASGVIAQRGQRRRRHPLAGRRSIASAQNLAPQHLPAAQTSAPEFRTPSRTLQRHRGAPRRGARGRREAQLAGTRSVVSAQSPPPPSPSPPLHAPLRLPPMLCARQDRRTEGPLAGTRSVVSQPNRRPPRDRRSRTRAQAYSPLCTSSAGAGMANRGFVGSGEMGGGARHRQSRQRGGGGAEHNAGSSTTTAAPAASKLNPRAL